jgi:hypothetical protein
MIMRGPEEDVLHMKKTPSKNFVILSLAKTGTCQSMETLRVGRKCP